MKEPGRNVSNREGRAGDRDDVHDVRPHSISVVIVNFNTGTLLTDVVKTVLAQTVPPHECIIVDNASTDGSIDHLRGEIDDDRVVILQMETNLGFAGGCNRGITESTGTYILLLNPDCFLEPDTLEGLLGELSSDDKAGAAGPLVLNMDGTEQRGCRRDIPTPWQIFCVGVGLHRMMPRHPRFRSFNSIGSELPDKTIRVQSISGSCMLIPRRVVNLVGLLDERYFMHFEDLDWCMRAGEAGCHILFVPDVIARHVGGVSSRDRPFKVEMHKHTSLIRFVRLNFAEYYPSAFIAMVSTIVYARWLMVAVRMFLIGKPRIQKGWFSLFIESDSADDRTTGDDS